MEKDFEKIIYSWVKEHFGQSEADDPSWFLKALAGELAKHFPELYEKHERKCLAEDVSYVAAEHMGVELTEQQIADVVDDYYYSDGYSSCDIEAIEWHIHRVMGE